MRGIDEFLELYRTLAMFIIFINTSIIILIFFAQSRVLLVDTQRSSQLFLIFLEKKGGIFFSYGYNWALHG